jgi:hypothetical protein
MRAIEVIKQLQMMLPQYTDAFTDNFSVANMTRVGTTVSVTTATDHGLASNDYANIVGAKTYITIDTLTQINGVATATTSQDHTLTLAQEEVRLGREKFVNISGANESEYNGSHKLLSVPDRGTFTFEISPSAPTPATGSPILEIFGLGYEGRHLVTVVDPTNFTFQTSETPNSPAIGTIEARTKARISGAVEPAVAELAYTKKEPGKIWAFVVTGDKVANKDRHNKSDAISAFGSGDEYRQLVIQPFSILCFFPATDYIAARQSRDAADDLVLPFCKSLLRFKIFSPNFTEDPYSGTVFSGDRFLLYNNAYYVHQYDFETTAWMVYGDTIDPEYEAAFRDISLSFESSLNPDAGVIMTADIKLDTDN